MQPLRTTCPLFSSFGVQSVAALQYTVQKHEVFNGPFPHCVRIVKVSWCLERQVFAFELATHSTLKLNMKISATSTLKRGGIHSLFVKWRSYFHATLGNRFILLSLTSTESKKVIWEDNSTFLRQLLALSFVCLKMIVIIKSSYHPEKNRQTNKKNNQSFE